MKLTERQFQALDAVCRTNGGGISGYSSWKPQLLALEKKGLVQGKAGQQYRAVHTSEGLALWREVTAKKS
jgi:hypothetical protein